MKAENLVKNACNNGFIRKLSQFAARPQTIFSQAQDRSAFSTLCCLLQRLQMICCLAVV